MEVWSFMEMIHSRSYTYVIKNVYSDPSEVFDKILSDDRILDRASSVTESYDTFINEAHQYDTSNCGDQIGEIALVVLGNKKKLRGNFIVQLLMSTFWKVSAFTYLSLVVLLLVSLNSWKDLRKSYRLLQEMRISIWQ